jgi:hypothetical protein
MYRPGVVAIVLFWLMSWSAYAGNLCLVGGEAVSGDSQAPLQFVLGVVANGMEEPYGLIGWQLRIKIIPDPAASGFVSFGSISEPPNYVFSGVPEHEITLGDTTLDTLVATDNIFEAVLGGTVPPMVLPDANLLAIELIPSNAVGRFNIEVMVTNTDTDSIWYAADWTPTLFDVESVPGQSPGIVESVVFVPEPPCDVMLLSGATVFAIGWARVLRRNRGSRPFRRPEHAAIRRSFPSQV